MTIRSTAGVARRAIGSVTAARRARACARRLPAPDLPPGPPPKGRLESYFDAVTTGPGVWKWRHYFPMYERHLERFVGSAPRILEVGVYSGGSLQMWLDYFGEGTHVYGVDIDPVCRRFASDRVSVVIGDQADPRFWDDFRRDHGPVDVVIDDGGHEPDQQIATLEGLLPHIRAGGVYVCEDIHGALQPFHAYLDVLSHGLSDVVAGETPPRLHHHVASVHRYPFAAVIEKPAFGVAAFEAPRHGSEWQQLGR